MSARPIALPAALALAQMVLPVPAGAATVMIAMCGDGVPATLPLRIPRRDSVPSGAPCCKVCHIAMRKRAGAATCCMGEDETDAT